MLSMRWIQKSTIERMPSSCSASAWSADTAANCAPAASKWPRTAAAQARLATLRAAGIDPKGVSTHTGRRTVVDDVAVAGLAKTERASAPMVTRRVKARRAFASPLATYEPRRAR